MNLAGLLNIVDQMNEMIRDEAAEELHSRSYELFGQPPSFDKTSQTYLPGNPAKVEELKSILQDYLLY